MSDSSSSTSSDQAKATDAALDAPHAPMLERGLIWLAEHSLLLLLLISFLTLLGGFLFWLYPPFAFVAGLLWACVGLLVMLLLAPPSMRRPVVVQTEQDAKEKMTEPGEALPQGVDLTHHLKVLDAELEQLHDQNWELREAELKYNALLNRQGDVIIHQGDDGSIHYANKAFDEWFDRDQTSAPFHMGQDYLEEEGTGHAFTAEDSPQPPESRERDDIRGFERQLHVADPLHERLIETKKGPRWFRWTETLMRSAQRKETLRLIIARDITAFKRVEAASEAKSRFLATISHEMRTPLNGVIGMANLLQATDVSPEQESYIQALRQSGSSLLSLVNDVLDLSKVEAGKLSLKEDWTSPVRIIEEVAELLAPDAQEKGLSIASWMAPQVPEKALFDPVRVRQILINLLGNAVKFTEKGAINITLEFKQGEEADQLLGKTLDMEQCLLCFQVKDTGIGIEKDQLERLFGEFEQVDTGRSRRHEGAGLGLAISRRLAHLMQGDIVATSEQAQGSLFTLLLPVSFMSAEEGELSTAPLSVSLDNQVMVGIDLTEADQSALASYCRDWNMEFRSLSLKEWEQDDTQFGIDHMLINGADPAKAVRILSAFDPAKTGILTRPAPKSRIILLEPTERHVIAEMRECGITNYLVKPVRKSSLLSALKGEASHTTALKDQSTPYSEQSPKKDPDHISLLPDEASKAVQTEKGEDQAAESTLTQEADQDKDHKMRILLVEDNKINAILASSILTKAGMNVVLAHSGKEALDLYTMAEAPNFEVALLDLHMPDMDGLTLFDEMQQQDASSGIMVPKIAFTADALQETRKACLDHGFDDFIVKPIDPPVLVSKVRAFAEQGKGQSDQEG
ncbi:MAG: ATP-binding protein [Cohaesibacter sp.]|nr:ATP-binding protein [Cohaesibacter sp.]